MRLFEHDQEAVIQYLDGARTYLGTSECTERCIVTSHPSKWIWVEEYFSQIWEKRFMYKLLREICMASWLCRRETNHYHMIPTTSCPWLISEYWLSSRRSVSYFEALPRVFNPPDYNIHPGVSHPTSYRHKSHSRGTPLANITAIMSWRRLLWVSRDVFLIIFPPP